VGGYICYEFSTGGGAELVVDDFKAVAFCRQPEHGMNKVLAAGGIHPGCSEYQMQTAAFADCFFAFQLGFAVNVYRPLGIVFMPGAGMTTEKKGMTIFLFPIVLQRL